MEKGVLNSRNKVAKIAGGIPTADETCQRVSHRGTRKSHTSWKLLAYGKSGLRALAIIA